MAKRFGAAWIVLLGSLLTASAAGPSETVTEAQRKEWLRRLIPLPHEIAIMHKLDLAASEVRVRFLEGAGKIEAHAAGQVAMALGVTATTQRSGDGFEILIGVCDAQGKLADTIVPDAGRLATLPNRQQAYVIRPVGESQLVLAALDEKGVYYASQTLRQLLEHGRRGDRITIPLVSVTDWPDIEERGLWGCLEWATLDLPAMAAHKMNLAELHETQLKVLPDGRGTATFDVPNLDAARLSAMKIVPIITHFDRMETTGLFEIIPELKGKPDPSHPSSGKVKAFPCASQPKFVDVLADWLTDLANCKGVDKVCVWLSEHPVQCGCESCQKSGQYVQEARAVVAAWKRVRQKKPSFGLRILLTQGSYSTNDKVIAEIPESVGITYYDGSRTYDSTRRPMIYPLLEQLAAKGRWLGCYPQLTAWWRIVCPWSGPQFIKARMTEFAGKKLRCVCGYATPAYHLYDFNLTAAAEWSWNAEGRSEREFAAAWATQRGLGDPELVADWADTLGPISWDVYGSYIPYPAFFGSAAAMIEKRKAPQLGADMFRYFPEPEQFERDLAGADRAMDLAKRIGDPGIVQETLVIRGYVQMLREIYGIAALVSQADRLSDDQRTDLRQRCELLTEASRQTAAALEAWEASIKPGLGGARFKDTVNVTRDVAAKIVQLVQPQLEGRPGPGSVPAQSGDPPPQTSNKQAGVLFPPAILEAARSNAATLPWGQAMKAKIVEMAEPWLKMSDDQLWNLMFGPTIKRSWMVWSNGHCPACKKGVPMYNWEPDALNRPWKMRCPHCKALFPTNDFGKFYRSGLDEYGVFDPAKADRKLLLNVEHPDPSDPLHTFGVDDGDGYVEGDKRWRFIGAYLIYGQWKQAVLGGIRALAAAYVVTGDQTYAHKTGVLIDRVADLYPAFDFKTQAILYEGPGAAGYVSTWHDACEEVRELAMAYDQVFAGLKDDRQLVTFLAGKAKEYKLDNPKASWADVQRNIEERILNDTLKQNHKIRSNYPRTDIANAVIHTVLGTPEHRKAAEKIIDALIEKGTAVDGVTGEKGLSGYGTIGPTSIAALLGQFALLDPNWLAETYKKHPRLRDCYRFHVDTWCLAHYYPTCGDAGSFASRVDTYAGATFLKPEGRSPTSFATGPLTLSMYTFMYQMYKLTGDPAFAQVTYLANGRSVEGLPHDLFVKDPEPIRNEIASVIEREGPVPKVGSVNKQQWHLAILRSGQGEHARAAWLDYDSGGGHSHADGLNLGLYAYGLDLMPDFGYPPVQFGGWGSPRAAWYTMTAAHNTVVVDGKNQQRDGVGQTELWGDGQAFRAIKASEPGAYKIPVYERTVASVDVSEQDFYVVDVFRVRGGKDHAEFMGSHFGTITTQGLNLQPAAEYGQGSQLRNLRVDPKAAPGWSADFKVEDLHKYLTGPADIHVRYTNLTADAQGGVAEAWVVAGIYDSTEEMWMPRLMVRRQSEQDGLASTFVGVIEPYEKQSKIAGIRRLDLTNEDGKKLPEPCVAVEVQLGDGRKDLIAVAEVEIFLGNRVTLANPPLAVQADWKATIEGHLAFVRTDRAGQVQRIALCRAQAAKVGDVAVRLKKVADFVEIAFEGGKASVVGGQKETIVDVTVGGKSVWQR